LDALPLGSLIGCKTCRYAISKEAAACPKCGAPNTWLHPEIARFVRCLDEFDHMPRFDVRWDRYILVGQTVYQPGLIDAAQNFIGSLGFFAPLSIKGIASMAAACAMQSGVVQLLESAKPGVEAFGINFSLRPAEWDSTNDRFWADVMDFFRVRD
jgi:hypothetical protein